MNHSALLAVYKAALARCTPERLTREAIFREKIEETLGPDVDLVALGKCAAGLIEGATPVLPADRIFIAAPEGYARSSGNRYAEIVEGSHPELSPASFHAGERLAAFVESSRRPILFLISGGSSACVELPLRPWFDEVDLIEVNHALIRSGLPIGSINLVRRHLSAIKGGRLGALAPSGSKTMIYSDVSRGDVSDVGSGPTLPDDSTNEQAAELLRSLGDMRFRQIAERLSSAPEPPRNSNASRAFLIADNATLRSAAADEVTRLGLTTEIMESDLESDVSTAVERIIKRFENVPRGRVLIAGGEPTVVVRGSGTGGRCSELAVRFAMACRDAGLRASALFAGSDGLDGNTNAAGIVLSCGDRGSLDRTSMEKSLAMSDSFEVARQLGSPLVSGPTGNNLRDLYLMARI